MGAIARLRAGNRPNLITVLTFPLPTPGEESVNERYGPVSKKAECRETGLGRKVQRTKIIKVFEETGHLYAVDGVSIVVSFTMKAVYVMIRTVCLQACSRGRLEESVVQQVAILAVRKKSSSDASLRNRPGGELIRKLRL